MSGRSAATSSSARRGWKGNAQLGPAYRQVMRELAWRCRVTGLVADHDRPGYVRELLGPVPGSTRGRRAWRQAGAIQEYRTSYDVQDPLALAREPADPAQRTAWRQARQAVERVWHKQRAAERSQADQPTPMPADRAQQRQARVARQGPERAAG